MPETEEPGPDADLLKRARRILKTSSDVETLNAALDRVVFQAEVMAGLRWLGGSGAVRDPFGDATAERPGDRPDSASYRVVSAEPFLGFRALVRFADGLQGVVDLSDVAGKGALARWMTSPSEFKQMTIDPEAGTLVWPGGLDVAPDRLYAEVLAAGGTTAAQRAAAVEAIAAMNLPVGTPQEMKEESQE